MDYATPRPMRRLNRPMLIGRRRLGAVIVAVLVLYLAGAAAVFDFRSPAYAYDQEYSADGRKIAYGPCPRQLLCFPRGPSFLWDRSYNGTEWAFTVYRPVCRVWIGRKVTRHQVSGRRKNNPL